MQFIIGFVIVGIICWLLEQFALFCDFVLPQIQEKKYKEKFKKTYNDTTYKEIIGLKSN